MAVKKAEAEIEIPPLRMASTTLRIIGLTPMFQNRMSAKAKQQLLLGGRKKTAADKAQHLKHDPLAEYRAAMEIIPGAASVPYPTALGLRVIAIKAAMCTAALETAGITKSSAQRLLFMPGELAPLYGTPYLRMDVVRSADINKTPDVRTRAFLPKWGAEITVQHVFPQMSTQSVAALLANAGLLVGVGDFRQEKGKGSFGSFRVIGADEDDAEWNDLVQNHGRIPQLAAIEDPEYAGDDTADLMESFFGEQKRRAA